MPRTESGLAIGAVVMAAGAGSRMGGVPKSLIQRDGEPLLLRQIRLLTEAGIDTIAVVLGYYALQISGVLEKTRWSAADSPVARAHLKWTINPFPDDGPASSLRCGLKALPPGLPAIMVVLGDQPLLETQDVMAVLQAWEGRSAGIELVVPKHGEKLGHPIVFSSALRAAVMAGAGVRDWRQAHAEQTRLVSATHDRYTVDVDTREDLARVRAEHAVDLVITPAK